MAPTYVVFPFITAICFGAATLTPLVVLARSSLLFAGVVAVLWLLLLVALSWHGHLEVTATVAALLTWALTRVAAAEVSRSTGWSAHLVEIGLVGLVMGMLAAVNQALHWRRRDR